MITAKNDAGLTQAEYVVDVPSSSSASSFSDSPTSSSSMVRSRNLDFNNNYVEVPLYRNMAFILPIALSLAVIVFLIVIAFYCIHRPPQPIYSSYPGKLVD